ncbi:MAG: serine hydrolase [Pirellulales bacterium]
MEEGRCAFETQLVDILPDLRTHYDADVTIERLLAHTSGLGDYIDDEAALPFTGMDVAALDLPRDSCHTYCASRSILRVNFDTVRPATSCWE